MAKLPNPYICDVCGTQKRETNRWYVCRPQPVLNTGSWSEGILFMSWDVADETASLEFSGVQHLCSEQCCTKALSKWLESQKA